MSSRLSTEFLSFLKSAIVVGGMVLCTVTVWAEAEFEALMTKGKLAADLGDYEIAANTFAAVANASSAPTEVRSEALVRYGLVCSVAGKAAESMQAFKTVREKYSGEPEIAAMLIGALASGLPGKVWIDFKTEFEDLLKTAEIVSSEEVGPGGGAFIRVVYLRWNGVEVKTVWRSSDDEITAYELDKILGLDLVPPAVAREFEGRPGSLQLWVHDCRTFMEMRDEMSWDLASRREWYRMRMFDYLIANEDRNSGNILIDPQGRIVGIDHDRTFSLRDFSRQLPRRFDRQFVVRLRNLSELVIRVRLERLLDAKAIDGVLNRKAELLAHCDRLIDEKGESEVLF